MDAAELKLVTAEALGKDPDSLPENPQWDSLDQLEIISHLHDVLGDRANTIDDLENFTDLESLTDVLRNSGLVV
jgi:acyl carrier protein